MTERQACQVARSRARHTGREVFIVWSVEDTDEPRQHYHVASEDDLEGFYFGCEPVLCVQPDGTIEA